MFSQQSRPMQCECCGTLGAHGGKECPRLVAEHEQRMAHAQAEHDFRMDALQPKDKSA